MKRFIKIGIAGLVAFTIVCVLLFNYVSVSAQPSFISVSVELRKPSQLAPQPAAMKIVFEPSGTHIKDGYIKVRFDVYPSETDKSYPLYHVYVVDEASPEWLAGYKGKLDKEGLPVDQVDYDKWVDGTPHIWRVNPMICCFFTISPLVTRDELTNFVLTALDPDTIATLDDILSTGNDDTAHLISPLMRNKTVMSKAVNVIGITPENEVIIKTTLNARFATAILEKGIVAGVVQNIAKQSIDVGSTPGNYNSSITIADAVANYRTAIDYNNPANATGNIDTVQSYWSSATAGNSAKVGSFAYISGTTFTCNDAESIGEQAAGSLQTDTGLTIAINSGEYIGVDGRAAKQLNLEAKTTTGAGAYYRTGQYCDPADSGSYTLYGSEYLYALYGTGTEAGGTYDITNSPDNVTMNSGNPLTPSTAYWAIGHTPDNPIDDTHCTFTLTSTGSAITDIDFHGHNTTGGTAQTLVSTAPGVNEYRVKIFFTGENPSSGGSYLTTSDVEEVSSLAAGGHTHWDLTVETGGTSETTPVAKSGVITITGRAP